jgi:hypothetical protein
VTYDSITSVGGDCYTALEDAIGVPADEPAIGLIQFSTAAQLKAGKPVRVRVWQFRVQGLLRVGI